MPNSVCSSRSISHPDANDYYCIFLHIIEGVGFHPENSGDDFNQEKIIVNASLSNIKFEVEGRSLSKDSATIFNNFCVWECLMKDIKRMKTDNRPVKIECYYKDGGSQFTGSKIIGSILLPVRGLQPVQSLRNIKLKMNWHKLGSLSPEFRQTKPEICLMMLIAKKELIESGRLERLIREGKSTGLSNVFAPDRSETAFMLQSQNNVYVQLLENLGAIQVGNNPDIDCDNFLVTFTFKQVRHIEKLMDLDAVCASNRGESFIFCYDLLGKTSALETAINRFDCYTINDKITLSFLSSCQSLRLFFQRIFYIPVSLYYYGKALATYRINFDKLMPDSTYLDMKHIWTKNGTFFFDQLYKNLSPRTPKPSVSYTFTIEQTSFNNKKNLETTPKEPLQVPYKSSDIPVIDLNTLNTNSDTEKFSKTENIRPYYFARKTDDHESQRSDQSHVDIGIQVDDLKENSKTVDVKFVEDDLIYNMVKELEEWKKKEMAKYEETLKMKEHNHWNDLRKEWEQEVLLLRARLDAKIAQCEELTAHLEKANSQLQMTEMHSQDSKNFNEKLRCEIECNYTTKFAMLEQQIEHLKVESFQKDALYDLQRKAKNIEIEKIEQEKSELQYRLNEIEKERALWMEVKKDSANLKTLLEELKVKTDLINEIEKEKCYYRTKWGSANKQIQELRMQIINMKKPESTATTTEFSNACLQSILSDEQECLEEDRSELTSIKNALVQLKSLSDVSDIDF